MVFPPGFVRTYANAVLAVCFHLLKKAFSGRFFKAIT
jgi:hypothetical protein